MVLVATPATAMAEGPQRQDVAVDVPPNAVLLERAYGADRWDVVCTGRCTASVLPDPYATHVLSMKKSSRLVRIDEGDARITLKKPDLGGPIAGIVIGGVGVLTMVTGASLWIAGGIEKAGPLFEGSCASGSAEADRRCASSQRAKRAAAARDGAASIDRGQVLMAVGAGIAMVGGLVLLATLRKAEIVKEPRGAGVRILPLALRAEGRPLPVDALMVPVVGGRF